MTNQLQQKTEAYSDCGQSLSPAADVGGGLLHILDGFVSALLGFLVRWSGSLLSRGLLLGVLGGSHGLLPLGLPDLGLLVPLGHDVLEGGANHGTLELLGPLVPFLGDILLSALLVLPSVQHSPGGVARISLQDMGLVSPATQEPAIIKHLKPDGARSLSSHLLVALPVHLDQGPPVAGVDLVAGVHTQVYLHGDFVFCNNTEDFIICIIVLLNQTQHNFGENIKLTFRFTD